MTANDQKIAAAKAAVRKRVVGYIRVSDPKQELKYGPQAQRADIEEYCAKKGYELLHIYYDAMTGVIWRERPGLTALRDAARLQDAEGKGPFEAVVVGRLDRLAREDEIQTVIMEDLAYHCVKTESATEKIEDSPAGRFMLHVYGFMAAEDRKRIIQRTDDGRRARAREGKLLGGGPATYGYKWNEDRTAFLVNDDVIKVDKTGFRWTEAKVVKFVFQKYKEGWSIRRIRLYIQELGIPTRKGKSIWQDSMIHNILKNSYYAGKAAVYRNKYHIVYNNINGAMRRGRTLVEKRPEDQQIILPDGVVPALVDQETYDIAQQQLERNKQRAARNNRNPEAALLRCGLLVCGYCGGVMVMTTSNVKRAHGIVKRTEYICNVAHKRYGKCQGVRIDATVIDKIAWEYVVEHIKNPSLVNQALDAQRLTDNTENDLSPVDRSIAAKERKIKSYQYALDKAIEDGAENEIIDGFMAKLDALAKEKRTLETEQRAILKKRRDVEEENRAIENFRVWCAEIRDKLDDPNYNLTYEKKRRACERLGIKVTIWRREHKPWYTIEATPTDIASIAS